MIARIVKITVALVLIHAAARAGIAASKYYRFRDAARQVVVYGGSAPTDQLADRIFAEATELAVPVERYDIEVRRIKDLTTADVFYVEYLPLLPGYTYPAELSFSVESRALAPATLPSVSQ